MGIDKQIGYLVKFRVFFNSLFISARFNPVYMQGLGFALSLKPVFEKLYPNKSARCEALLKYIKNFNCHPYFATIISGAVYTFERDKLAGKIEQKRITRLIQGFSSSLAAIGDIFFWGSLKPLTAVLGASMLFTPYPWAAPLVLIITYNSLHFYIRISGFRASFNDGHDFLSFIDRWKLPRLSVIIKRLTLFLLAFLVLVSVKTSPAGLFSAEAGLALAAAGIGAVIFLKKGGNSQMMAAFLFSCVIIGFIK